MIRYRIVTDGQRFKIQRRAWCWFGAVWVDAQGHSITYQFKGWAERAIAAIKIADDAEDERKEQTGKWRAV